MKKMQNELKKNIYKLLFKCGFKKYKTKYEKYKNICKTPKNTGFEDLKKEIFEIKRMLIIKEICPEAFNLFKHNVAYDISEKAAGYPSNSYDMMEMNSGIADDFIEEIVNLKLAELNNGQNIAKIAEYIEILLPIIKKISHGQPLKKAQMYLKLVHSLSSTPNFYKELDRVFKEIKINLCDINILPELALRYMSFCLLKDNEEEAISILRRHIALHEEKYLTDFLPVANLACKIGIGDNRVKLASNIFEKFMYSSNNNIFEKYVKNKKVAIVGNGPQELGTNNGKIIDSYDEVIRFNDFDIDESHIADYGKKVTVWSKNRYNSSKFFENVKLHIYRINPYLGFMGNKIDEYSNYLNKDYNFIWFPDELYWEIFDKYKIVAPTGGFQMVYWLKKINKDFSIEDCFGFSFKKDGYTGHEHYNRNTVYRSGHSFNDEFVALRSLFNEVKQNIASN